MLKNEKIQEKLRSDLCTLEIVSGFEIPKVEGAVVSAGHQDIVGVDCQAVENGVVAGQILNEFAFGTLPLFDIVR